MTTHTSNQTANKALVTSYVTEVWNNKNLAALENFIAKDLIQHNPNLPNGSTALAGFMKGLFENVPHGHFTLVRLIAEADLVVSRALFKAGPEDRGMAVVDIYRVADGKLVEHWDIKEAIPETIASGNTVV